MNSSQLIETIDSFKVNFGGEKHTIDAELFTKTINNAIDLVKASASAIDPNCFLRLDIKANKKGSFITEIDAIARHIPDLITKENAQLACQICVGFWAFLQIKSHLKGRKPKEIKKQSKKTKIINQDNSVIEVDSNIADSFFKNNQIDNSIINIFTDLKESDKENFTIEHQQKKIIFNKHDYSDMSQVIIDGNSKTSELEIQEPIKVNLRLKKPDLLGNSSWQFVYNKNIYAKIEDKEFLEKVHTGQIKTLYAGVKIPCMLQIEYELDSKFNHIPNSDKYTIKKITGDIIEPPTQIDLLKRDKNRE